MRFLYAKHLGTDKEEAAAFLRPTEETLAMERRIEDVLGNQSRRWVRSGMTPASAARGGRGPVLCRFIARHRSAVQWATRSRHNALLTPPTAQMYYHLFKSQDTLLHAWGVNEPKNPFWQRLLLKATFPLLKYAPKPLTPLFLRPAGCLQPPPPPPLLGPPS